MLGQKVALQHGHGIGDPSVTRGIIAPKMLVRINFHLKIPLAQIKRARRLSTEIEESPVDRIIRSGDEGCFIRTKKEGQRGDFLRLTHAADGLRRGQLLKHFLLATWIIFSQVTINEWSVHASGRDAVAADLVR